MEQASTCGEVEDRDSMDTVAGSAMSEGLQDANNAERDEPPELTGSNEMLIPNDPLPLGGGNILPEEDPSLVMESIWESSSSVDGSEDIDMGLPYTDNLFEGHWAAGNMDMSQDADEYADLPSLVPLESLEITSTDNDTWNMHTFEDEELSESDQSSDDDDAVVVSTGYAVAQPAIFTSNYLEIPVMGPIYNPDNPGLSAAGPLYSFHGMSASQYSFNPQAQNMHLPTVYMDDDEENDQVEFDSDGVTIIPGDAEADDADTTRFMNKLFYKYNNREELGVRVSSHALQARDWKRPDMITAKMMKETGCDSQAIPWGERGLGISREDARRIRIMDYKNFAHHKRLVPAGDVLPNKSKLYDFHSVDCTQKCRPIHFQLRNLLAATSSSDVFYANDSSVKHTNPRTRRTREILNLSLSGSHYRHAYRITTMTAAQNVLVVGDYCGMYAMKALDASPYSPNIQGAITESVNGITNHVHITPHRTTNSPVAIFCSNDASIRRLDCASNTFLTPHHFDYQVNCAATSPDTRLRLVVGDMKETIIISADTGKILRTLKGHQDYGFAAAWSDNGRYLATGNQDKTVRVYDVRNTSQALRILRAEMAGVRALRFSPSGSGPQVLAMTESTDYVHMVDAAEGMFDKEQRWECFGDIGGVDFSPDGEELFVANTDKWFGGLVKFKRSWGARKGGFGRGRRRAGWDSEGLEVRV